MTKTTQTKSRLMGFFDKHPGPHSVANLMKHFTEFTLANLGYHLKTLIDSEFLIRSKKGVYEKNPAYLTPEQKLAKVKQHIHTNGARVEQGAGWKPGEPPLKTIENPVMIAFLGRSFGESIIERMKSTGFTSVELRFVGSLLSEKYPLTEQQRVVAERTMT